MFDDIAGLATAFDELADPCTAARRGSRGSAPLREQVRRRLGCGGVAERHHRGAGRWLAGSVHSCANRSYQQEGAVTRKPVGALQSDDLSISAVQGDACELPEQIRREQFDIVREDSAS